MTDRFQVTGLIAGAALLVAVLELVRRRKLTEEYSLLWIVSALALLGLSARRGILETMAAWLGMKDLPLFVALLVLGAACAAALGFSVIMSRQRRQIERLTEEAAILSAELRDLRASRSKTGR